MKIFFPSSNPSKPKRYETSFKNEGIDFHRFLTIDDVNGNEVPLIIESDITESGKTTKENAHIKAKAYYDYYRPFLPNTQFAIMTTDEALYFRKWDRIDERQPGLRVRRIR